MTTYLEKIKKKINKEFSPEKILLIDNSNAHVKHKSFDPKKYHLKLIIKSKKLQNISRIESHKAIFSVLDNEMKSRIHALEIKIE